MRSGRIVKTAVALAALLAVAETGRAALLLGVERETGTLYSISTTDASLGTIGNTGLSELGSLEFGPDGKLYGFTTGDAPALYEIDPGDAGATLIGSGLGIGFVFEGGLAFAPDGRAYGTNQLNAFVPKLFSVDVSTGGATLIGTISGGQHDINGLAWRSDGMLVGIDRVTGSILAINPTDASSSVIASLTPTVGDIGGMTAVGDMGYFVTAGPGGNPAGSNELWSIDLMTGDHMLIGGLAPTIANRGLGGIAIPEPATLLLAAIAVLPVWWMRRLALRI